MDIINSENRTADNKALTNDAEEKEEKDSFEIVIRGSEIFRINSQTKEIVQVFQCVDHCLRGNKINELYAVDFELLGHSFSITGKESSGNQYIVNIFGDAMFTINTERISDNNMENKTIFAVYEECLNEYVASFIMENENMEIRVWITID